MNHFLFVYGMLRKGGGASLEDKFPGARSIGSATINGSIFDLGDYPGLRLDGSDELVFGEVYAIDERTLAALDEFEASADYRRFETSVFVNGASLSCWVYCPDSKRCDDKLRIESGDWIEYVRSRKTHL